MVFETKRGFSIKDVAQNLGAAMEGEKVGGKRPAGLGPRSR